MVTAQYTATGITIGFALEQTFRKQARPPKTIAGHKPNNLPDIQTT
ncbi:MAG: hypothetical protein LBK06_07280 [Planctomycetaceae bacterium]|jgi:hypothetical protein|nr:hypothetical protein [Planctomycetaceae bacterium]